MILGRNSQSKRDNKKYLAEYKSGIFNTYDKEFLAILKGIENFEIYLISHKFIIWIESKNFKNFVQKKVRKPALKLGWLRKLQKKKRYNFEVEYIKGYKNYFSRFINKRICSKTIMEAQIQNLLLRIEILD